MPICRECRLGVPPSYDACPKCGNPLSTAAIPAPPTASMPSGDDYESFFVNATPVAKGSPVATAPVAAGDLGETACSVCGRRPATRLWLRRQSGFLLVRTTRITAAFCRPHGEAAAQEFLRRTMVEGWWGLFSFLLNWFSISADMRALRTIRRLPVPVGEGDTSLTHPLPDDVAAAVSESAEDRAARTSVLRTVALAIGLGVVALVVVSAAVNHATDSVLHRFGIELSTTTLLYVAVALIVASKLRTSPIHPRASEGSSATGVAVGLLVGGGAALCLGLLFSALSGHLTSDPRVLDVIFEGNGSLTFIVVFISVIAAPLVEEILFRGLLVESLRSRGRTSAVLGGAVAFSLWHLNPAALRYYVLMGFLFGWLYWRFGLAGSVSAHGAFNGVLVVFAFAALAGTTTLTTTSGVTVRLPGGWHEVHSRTLTGVGIDVAAGSPLGAGFVVGHAVVPSAPGAEFTPPATLPNPPPGATDVRNVTVSGTTAVRFTITHGGEESTLVVVPRGSARYVVTLVPARDDKARADLDAMLSSLRLP